MVYANETSKWKAYQLNDPFATGSFFVCNKISQIFCRPDCDAHPTTNLKSEIKFVDTYNDAINSNFKPCESCDPINSTTCIDVNLLIKCVSTVNTKIGFIPPLLDENEDVNSSKIKQNILQSKKINQDQILSKINNINGHRNSMPIINYQSSKSSTTTKDMNLSKLVDLACRHLALAAAINVFQPKQIIPPTTPEEEQQSTPTNGKRRRRRGGVLGFKELASKSKLSAWHFHRVFKSVTGLTPKTYGDRCWEYIKKIKQSGEYTTFESYSSPSAITPATPVLKSNNVPPSSSSPSSEDNGNSPNSTITPSTTTYPITPPTQTSSSSTNLTNINSVVSDFSQIAYPSTISSSSNIDDQFLNYNTAGNNTVDDDINSTLRAFSFPDLAKASRTDSLFSHSYPLEYNQHTLPQQQPLQDQLLFSNDVISIPPAQTTMGASTTTLTDLPNTFNLFEENFNNLNGNEELDLFDGSLLLNNNNNNNSTMFPLLNNNNNSNNNNNAGVNYNSNNEELGNVYGNQLMTSIGL
ncbi:hypothetical protein SBY92_001786 [Candida maltosa Xu316]